MEGLFLPLRGEYIPHEENRLLTPLRGVFSLEIYLTPSVQRDNSAVPNNGFKKKLFFPFNYVRFVSNLFDVYSYTNWENNLNAILRIPALLYYLRLHLYIFTLMANSIYIFMRRIHNKNYNHILFTYIHEIKTHQPKHLNDIILLKIINLACNHAEIAWFHLFRNVWLFYGRETIGKGIKVCRISPTIGWRTISVEELAAAAAWRKNSVPKELLPWGSISDCCRRESPECNDGTPIMSISASSSETEDPLFRESRPLRYDESNYQNKIERIHEGSQHLS